jgi:hypothetical protein
MDAFRETGALMAASNDPTTETFEPDSRSAIMEKGGDGVPVDFDNQGSSGCCIIA